MLRVGVHTVCKFLFFRLAVSDQSYPRNRVLHQEPSQPIEGVDDVLLCPGTCLVGRYLRFLNECVFVSALQKVIECCPHALLCKGPVGLGQIYPTLLMVESVICVWNAKLLEKADFE